MPSSSSVAPTYCLHRPSRGRSEADKSFSSITDIVIDSVHSLVMVVLPWYVNIHLCPPSVGHTPRFLCSFSRSPKTTQGKRFKMKLPWTTIHRACIHLYNPELIVSVTSGSLCLGAGGYFITAFIMCMRWLIDLIFSLPSKCKNGLLSPLPLSVRSVECKVWL